MPIMFYHLDCNAPATFQRAVLAIFVDLVHDCVEVYMDDFSVYGNSFEHALENLENVLKRCIEANLSLEANSTWYLYKMIRNHSP